LTGPQKRKNKGDRTKRNRSLIFSRVKVLEGKKRVGTTRRGKSMGERKGRGGMAEGETTYDPAWRRSIRESGRFRICPWGKSSLNHTQRKGDNILTQEIEPCEQVGKRT